MTFPKAPVSRLRHCFETTASGHIPISHDWALALNALARLPHAYVQIDHAAGRMSMRMCGNELLDSIAGDAGERGLEFSDNFAGWSRGHATIEHCPCCGSAGSLSFHGDAILQFLRFSPSSDIPANEWAQILSVMAVSPRYASAAVSTDAAADWSCLYRPESAQDLHSRDLFGFLDRVARIQMPLTFTMRNPQVSQWNHTEIMSLELSDDEIYCRGSAVGFIVNASAVVRLSVDWSKPSGPLLLAVGMDDRILLEMSVLPEDAAQAQWAMLLYGF
jgi:hypothetical protein